LGSPHCPKKYHYQYVLGIPGEKKTYFELGTITHSVIEHLTRKMKNGEVATLEEGLSILNELWRASTYESKDKERPDRETAEKMIDDFLKRQATKEGQIIEIEKRIEIDLDGRKIAGKVDRIDDMGETLEVIDYKTSKNETSRPKLKQDYQMTLYSIGAEQAIGKPVGHVGHWYLRKDKPWMIKLTEVERNAVLERAREVIRKVEEKEYRATPKFDVCKFCDYGDLCEDKGKG